MNKIKQFMKGRYGLDHIGLLLALLSMIFAIIAAFNKSKIVSIIPILLLVLMWYRILSKKVLSRKLENDILLTIIKKIRKWFKKQKNKILNSRKYKYFKCPNCKQELRAPRGKGNIVVTCQKCKNKFEVKV